MMNKTNIKKLIYDILIKYHGLFVLLIVIDQVTKIIAMKYLSTPVEIFSWLKLSLSYNTGVAFSMFDDLPQWVSALVSIIATIAIEAYLIVKKPKDKVFVILMTFLSAGALGNGIDRWLTVFKLREGVVDFIYPTFFANFNVADIYVTCTCFILIVYMLFSKENKDDKKIVKAKLPSEIKAEQEAKESMENNNEQH